MMSAESTSSPVSASTLRYLIQLPVFFVDLIKADFLSLAARRKQSNRTRNERELQVTFPIRTRGHGLLHTNKGRCIEAIAFRL
jgi:hypothetical protein